VATLDGTAITIPFFVTHQDDFGDTLTIGENILAPLEMNLCAFNIESEIQGDARTKLGFSTHDVSGLIDTGAGPTCMSRKFYSMLGGRLEDLPKSKCTLKAANSSKMVTHGLSTPIDFTLGKSRLTMQFMIVEDLGSDDVILGRDFITMYDVGVDLPKKRICIRNAKLLYKITERYTADKGMGAYVGKISASTNIAPEEMKSCRFDVHSRRKRIETLRGHIRWLAYVEETPSSGLQDRGICAAKALAMVQNCQVELALVNANKLENQ
jgi:hypothetical protein